MTGQKVQPVSNDCLKSGCCMLKFIIFKFCLYGLCFDTVLDVPTFLTYLLTNFKKLFRWPWQDSDPGPWNCHRSWSSEYVLGVFQNLMYLCSSGHNVWPMSFFKFGTNILTVVDWTGRWRKESNNTPVGGASQNLEPSVQ